MYDTCNNYRLGIPSAILHLRVGSLKLHSATVARMRIRTLTRLRAFHSMRQVRGSRLHPEPCGAVLALIAECPIQLLI